MSRQDGVEELKIGDLVEKFRGPRGGTLAVVTDICMESYYEFNAWIRVLYVDTIGGYEWVHLEGLKILVED